MDKRGLLLAEETLKTVIAVIAIGFLVFFLASLYFANLNEKKQDQAVATLDQFSKVIESAEGGEILKINPEGWHIFSFIEEKPNPCLGKSCICICDNVIDYFDRQLSECSYDGRCLIVENLQSFEEIEIKDAEDSPTNINITKSDNKIIVEEI